MPEVASGLLLRPDRTFEYFFTYGAADYTAKGNWRSEPGAVILDSAGKEELPFRLLKTAAGDSPEIRVYVHAPNGRGVEHLEVILQTASDKVQARTGADGLAVLPRSGAKTLFLRVPVYDIEAGPFRIDSNVNEFRFEINGEAITQLRFRNERLKIAENDLEMTFWKMDKPLRYRKQ